MKKLGIVLIGCSLWSMDYLGRASWGSVFMAIAGVVIIFPNLLQYLFEGMSGERK
jgi:type IV secretory pathway VirB2 component (pilin)